MRCIIMAAVALVGCASDNSATAQSDAGTTKEDGDACWEMAEEAREKVRQLHASLARGCTSDDDCTLVSQRKLTRCFSFNLHDALARQELQAYQDGVQRIDEEFCGAFDSNESAACETVGEDGDEGVVLAACVAGRCEKTRLGSGSAP